MDSILDLDGIKGQNSSFLAGKIVELMWVCLGEVMKFEGGNKKKLDEILKRLWVGWWFVKGLVKNKLKIIKKNLTLSSRRKAHIE